MPHGTVKPIRSRYRDDDLKTTVSYRAGFAAECSCGWRSHFEHSYDAAQRLARAHAKEHK